MAFRLWNLHPAFATLSKMQSTLRAPAERQARPTRASFGPISSASAPRHAAGALLLLSWLAGPAAAPVSWLSRHPGRVHSSVWLTGRGFGSAGPSLL